MFYKICLMPRLHYDGFDNQERNLTLVKTDFSVLKLKFHACNFKHAGFLSSSYTIPSCQTGIHKRGISSVFQAFYNSVGRTFSFKQKDILTFSKSC